MQSLHCKLRSHFSPTFNDWVIQVGFGTNWMSWRSSIGPKTIIGGAQYYDCVKVAQLRPIWMRGLNQSLEWYDWDAKRTVDTEIIETPKNCSCFSILHTFDCNRMKTMKNCGRLNHNCASLGQGDSVISVSTVSIMSQSFRSQLGHYGAVKLGSSCKYI